MATIGTRARPRIIEEFDRAGGKQEPELKDLVSRLRTLGFPEHALAIIAARAFEEMSWHAQRCVHAAAERLQKLDLPSATMAQASADKVGGLLDKLKKLAHEYQQAVIQAHVQHRDADQFSREIVSSNSVADCLRVIVAKDSQILALGDGDRIRRGPLFDAWKPVADATQIEQDASGLRSPRLHQGYRLWSDSHGT